MPTSGSTHSDHAGKAHSPARPSLAVLLTNGLIVACLVFWAVLLATDVALGGTPLNPAIHSDLLHLLAVVSAGGIAVRVGQVIVDRQSAILSAAEMRFDDMQRQLDEGQAEAIADAYVAALERRPVPDKASIRHLTVTPRP